MATDSIDRVKRPFLHQKARSHFQRRRKVVDTEFSKALLARSHMVPAAAKAMPLGAAPGPAHRPGHRAPMAPALCRALSTSRPLIPGTKSFRAVWEPFP